MQKSHFSLHSGAGRERSSGPNQEETGLGSMGPVVLLEFMLKHWKRSHC